MKLNTKKMQDLRFEIGITLATTILLLLAFIPIFTMLLLSMKSNVQIYGDFFSLPNPIEWSNYSVAVGKLIPNMINTLLVVAIATACTMVLSVLSGSYFPSLSERRLRATLPIRSDTCAERRPANSEDSTSASTSASNRNGKVASRKEPISLLRTASRMTIVSPLSSVVARA